MIYWDTSSILKLYAEEHDSVYWQAIALAQRPPLLASALARVEMAFALRQKERRGQLASGAANALQKIFESDISVGRFLLVPMGKDVLSGCLELSANAVFLENRILLRTLDGLHLATALVMRCRSIATADVRLAEASKVAGLKIERV
jgi:predicted nucleic acid-binding protein